MNTAWMKGVPYRLVDTPMDPVSPQDDRPLVHDLIEEHREKIDKIANLLIDHPLYEPETKHDDLWIVRFYLTHKSTKKAVEAAQRTLEYRHAYKRDNVDLRRENFRTMDPEKNAVAKFLTYCDRTKGDCFQVCLEDTRGFMTVIQLSSVDSIRMAKEQPEEFWFDFLSLTSERCFQWIDYLTRTTGRLTKMVRIVDLSDYQFTKHYCRVNSRRTGAASHMLSDLYPQLVEACFVINASPTVQIPWNLFRPLLPSRIARRIDFIDPVHNKRHRRKLYRFVSHENLPVFLGGANKTPLQELEYYRGKQ